MPTTVAQLLAGGLAYTAGVVLSFVALAGCCWRCAPVANSWAGASSCSPGFVAALAALFTLIGLNLAGVFEFGIGAAGALVGGAGAAPAGRLVRSPACWRWPWRRRAPRRSWARRWAPA
jgi:thiol:disulfide interchange protein